LVVPQAAPTVAVTTAVPLLVPGVRVARAMPLVVVVVGGLIVPRLVAKFTTVPFDTGLLLISCTVAVIADEPLMMGTLVGEAVTVTVSVGVGVCVGVGVGVHVSVGVGVCVGVGVHVQVGDANAVGVCVGVGVSVPQIGKLFIISGKKSWLAVEAERATILQDAKLPGNQNTQCSKGSVPPGGIDPIADNESALPP